MYVKKNYVDFFFTNIYLRLYDIKTFDLLIQKILKNKFIKFYESF
jgi:hypothetical protein